MCGICGIINYNSNPVSENNIRLMMQKMRHRGPDDDGIFIDKNIGLGHVRLSIIDLTLAGHQPMFSDDGRYVLVFNGEVYNYIEIRSELSSKYNFKTNTDTEVLLKAYQEWGESCLDKFNGMWAFVIYDKETKAIFIARDRFGIKPLYYYLDKDKFIFASEIPPILSILENKPEPDKQSIFDYLVFNRTDQDENTFFEGIKKLKHGHTIRIQNSKLRIKRWYNLRKRVKEADEFKSLDEFREALSSSIDLRLRSDVPVGVCLSGGLDSSSIVSLLLKDFKKSDLNTFSAVYGEGIRGDESEFINEYKDILQNMHYTNPTAESLYNDMHQFVFAHAEPIPSTSPYAQFKVMELAKDNVVVTLDGQGADEELAGYHYFFGYFFKDLLRHFRFLKLSSEIFHYLVNHKSIYGVQTFIYFLLPEKPRTMARVSEKGYLQEDFVKQHSVNNSIAGNLYGSCSLHEALLDHFEYKLEHLLKWEDRNSMWFSLESRVPFLDHHLVEKVFSTSSHQIINKGMTKYILREAMKGIIPENIRTRQDKVGFETPEDEWFRTEKFKIFIYDLINSKKFANRGYLNVKKVSNLYKKHLDNKNNISKEIWKWINLELWFREFID